MTPVLVILLVVTLVATLGVRKGAANPAPKRARAAKRPAWSPYWLLGGVLFALVLLRFGVNWIVVAAGMVAALLRGLLPLLRFLPLLESFRRATSSRSSGPASAGGRAPGSSDNPGAGSSSGWRRPERMTREEALRVLGLDEYASTEDVQREYRRLMRKVHPDLGGSSYLAAKINEAKDVLS